jgi:hypothetical protein
MWHAPNNKIPESDIKKAHLEVLEEAVKDSEKYDIRTGAVYTALDYLEAKSIRTWGFVLFREALEVWNPSALHEGLKLIKKYLGC